MTSSGSGAAQESVFADPAAICDHVVRLVDGRADAEVTAVSGRSALTRFANSAIHQNVADDFLSVRLRLSVEGRVAGQSTNRVDSAGLAGLVESTLEAARLRPVDPDWPGMAPPTTTTTVVNYDPDTHLASPDSRARVVRSFVDAGDGTSEAAGFCSTHGAKVAFANTAGHRAGDLTSSAQVEGIHRLPGSDGRGWQSSPRAADLDGDRAGLTAAEKATVGLDAVDLEPGPYEVVLEPACVADIVSFIGGYGFNAKAHAEGRSFVSLGSEQFDPAVQLWDDATDPRTVGAGFDAEGTPRGRVHLVRDGVSTALVHDRRTAARAGTTSTGHAVAGGESWGPYPSHLFLGGGDSTPENLVASVQRGLLVTEFWYTRVLDPKTQVVTGLTRNGTFLIESGRVVGGVRNLRFTQSYVDALAPGNVVGIGNDARLYETSTHVPSLHLASWNFTGGARG